MSITGKPNTVCGTSAAPHALNPFHPASLLSPALSLTMMDMINHLANGRGACSLSLDMTSEFLKKYIDF